MFRINYLIVFFLIITSFSLHAKDQDNTGISLKLLCNIAFSNFDNIEHTVKTEEVMLTAEKYQRGGMQLVTQTSSYEFWVMTHGIQTINKRQFINNFQVAIKHKASQLFMHALSDTSHTPGMPPKHARVSLVDYRPDTNLEKGELVLECRHIK